MRDFIGKLGVPELIDTNLTIKDRERGYPESESILSLCWNAILGGDCLLDLNVLRGDPGLPELLGVNSVMAPTTAGEFLRKFTLGDLSDLQRVLQQAATQVRPLQKSDRVTVDLDASMYEQCSTRKQGSRMNYKGQVGYYRSSPFGPKKEKCSRRICWRATSTPRPKRSGFSSRRLRLRLKDCRLPCAPIASFTFGI